MLLRESGEQQNLNLALDSITAEAKNLGVENETVLLKIAEAVYKSNPEQMTRCRDEAIAIIGARATVDAIGVAAAFNGITKIANATGLPLDESTASSAQALRRDSGIDRFSETWKSRQYD
jgi:hypothetical protein